MKFAFSANAFRKYSLIDTIEILAGLGYEGIEIMADIPHAYPPDLSEKDIEAILATLDRCHMRISNINAFMLWAEGDTWHPSWIEADPAQRQKRIAHTLRCIDLAAKLGAPTISTEPGGPLDGMEVETGLRIFKEGLEAVESLAREKGVKVLIEPEPGLLIERSDQFLDFIDGLDQNVFALNFDIGHFYCVNEDPAALVPALQRHTRHYHLEDISADRVHHHLLPGLGAIDLPAVLQAINQLDYQGFVTVELYPYEDNPVETARKALAYLRALFPALSPAPTSVSTHDKSGKNAGLAPAYAAA